MSIVTALRKEIDSILIQHPAFLLGLNTLERLANDRFGGLEPSMLSLVGPSRIGKTMILQALAEKHPARQQNHRWIRPVLFVSVTPGTAPKDLPLSVIRALGAPIPRERSRVGSLYYMMLEQLRLAQTSVILFDEASHLVDVGSKVPSRQASDWFKAVSDEARVSIVLSGVFRLKRLLDSNEQLRGRSRKAVELMPYRWSVKHELAAFAGCAQAFMAAFAKHGYPIASDMNTDALMRNLYAASAGNIGILAQFFRALAAEARAPGPLDRNALHHASASMILPADGLITPFTEEPPSTEYLLQLYAAELAVYGVSVPIDSPHAELAAHRNAVRSPEAA
ncbi:TniB family NTP-binding protein [Thauera sp.]|uniref:TniB family NTP-binding protein n=1 Tax=Thauera sp. TaxID=1905334 RepID=UPI00257B9120|nr:TniB family NTP-binding protein [Thauera sp.]